MRQALIFSAAAAMLVGLVGCASTGSQCGPGCMTGTCYDAPETCAGCPSGCNTCPNGAIGAGKLGGGMHGRGMASNTVCNDPCSHCGILGCLGACRRNQMQEPFNPGPAAAAITYPYYTTRGPRDFFVDNPRSIGP